MDFHDIEGLGSEHRDFPGTQGKPSEPLSPRGVSAMRGEGAETSPVAIAIESLRLENEEENMEVLGLLFDTEPGDLFDASAEVKEKVRVNGEEKDNEKRFKLIEAHIQATRLIEYSSQYPPGYLVPPRLRDMEEKVKELGENGARREIYLKFAKLALAADRNYFADRLRKKFVENPPRK
jgi:hypothetical protein